MFECQFTSSKGFSWRHGDFDTWEEANEHLEKTLTYHQAQEDEGKSTIHVFGTVIQTTEG